MIGTDGITGVERFTFGTSILLGGISFVTAMVGLLAVAEILIEAEEPFKEYKEASGYRGMKKDFPKLSEFKKNAVNLTRSSIIGTIVGALPGAGATIAAFLAYGEAARTSKDPKRFGNGAVDGLMAAESANNASTGGAMTILLSLGIPGSNTTAMMIAAFLIHGLHPGPLLLGQRPDVVYGIFVAMLMTNLFLLGLTILGIRLFLQLNRLPYSVFSAAILILCVIGAFGLNNNVDELYMMFAFVIIGYFMRKRGGLVQGHHGNMTDHVNRRVADDEKFAALAFKIMTDPFVGKLTYFRVYSGTLAAGGAVLSVWRNRRERVGRLLQMHANKREEIKEARAGDIVAVVGLRDCQTGDTLCDFHRPIALESIEFPGPVISIAIEPRGKADEEKLGGALHKLQHEDPTFKVRTDEESGQTLISGMGELHLEIIVDRLLREFNVAANVGKPQVA